MTHALLEYSSLRLAALLAALLAAVAPQWAWQRLDTLTIADDQIVVDLASTARTALHPRAPSTLDWRSRL
jgi:hypothetical protein